MEIKSYHLYFYVLATTGLLISGTLCAKGDGNCELIDKNNNTITLDQWKMGITLDPIQDVQTTGTILLHYQLKQCMWVDRIYNNGRLTEEYIFAHTAGLDPEDNEFMIETGKNFHNYEDKEILSELILRVTFTCQNYQDSDIEFRIPIIDSNNHSPKFNSDLYTLTLPMPIPKVYMFEGITVKDVDLTNEKITINFDSNENLNGRFLIAPPAQESGNKKNHLTKLITSTMIDLDDDITFTLLATDSGNPPRTSSATVNIIVDRENSSPRFARPLYTADLAGFDYKKADKTLLKFAEGKITVTRGYKEIDNIEIRGCSEENKEHLKLTFSKASSKHGLVTNIELKNLTEEFLKQKVISVVLVAVKDHVEASTVLQILLPGATHAPKKTSETSCPIKENPLQSSTYDDSINGYRVATIILSVFSIGLMGFIIFLFLRKQIELYLSKIYGYLLNV